MFLPTDLSSVIGNNKDKVLRGHDIMVVGRGLGERANVNTSSGWVGIGGALDVRLVSLIHDKTAGRKTYASLAEVACAFYGELCAKFKSVSQSPRPWVAAPLTSKEPTSSGSKDMMNIRELDKRGAVKKTTLTELGFVVGASVKPKADSALT